MTLWAASARAELCVDVDLHFSGHAPEPELRAAIEQETTAIWAPYGVNLRWQVPACDVSDVSFDVFVARRLPASSPGRAVLGSTHVQLTCTDKVPIVIDAAVTEKTLGSLTMNELMERTGRLRVGPQELGRAFGRVLAHADNQAALHDIDRFEHLAQLGDVRTARADDQLVIHARECATGLNERPEHRQHLLDGAMAQRNDLHVSPGRATDNQQPETHQPPCKSCRHVFRHRDQ